jgi:hypothetical protein
MKRSVAAIVIALCISIATNVQAASRDFYISLINAIDRAEARGLLFLDPGTWKSSLGDTYLIWRIAQATRAKTHFAYEQGLLQRAQVEFATPITVTVARTVNNQTFCVTFRIWRIDYSEGGNIEPTSRLEQVPNYPDCNGRGGREELNRIAAISTDVKEVFTGRIFRGLGKLGRTVGCADQYCSITNNNDVGPISRVQLLGTTNEITLRGGAEITFPSGGSITTDSASRIKVATLDYDVRADKVDGNGRLRLSLSEADKSVTVGDMELNKGIALEVDLGGCDDVVEVACFLAGNIVLGSIGGVAAGILCDRTIDRRVGELTQRVKEETLSRVRALRFKVSL